MIEKTLGLPDRHPRRRQRPDLPAPRKRDGAGHLRRPRAGLRPLLDAQRLSEHGRGEDVQEPGQRGAGPRPGEHVPGEAMRWALLAGHYRQPLAWTDERWSSRRRSRSTGSTGALRRGRRIVGAASGRAAAPAFTRRRWRTTSTRRAPTPNCSPWPQQLETDRAAPSARQGSRASCSAGGQPDRLPGGRSRSLVPGRGRSGAEGPGRGLIAARVAARAAKDWAGPTASATSSTALDVEVMDGPHRRDLADEGAGLRWPQAPLRSSTASACRAPAAVIWAVSHDIDRWPEWNPLYPEGPGRARRSARC